MDIYIYRKNEGIKFPSFFTQTAPHNNCSVTTHTSHSMLRNVHGMHAGCLCICLLYRPYLTSYILNPSEVSSREDQDTNETVRSVDMTKP